MIIWLFVLGTVLGVTVTYFCLIPKVKETERLDEQTKKENEQIRTNNIQLKSEYSNLVNKTLIQEQHIKALQQQAEDSANALYEQGYALANEKMSVAADKLAAEYEEAKREMEEEYLKSMATHAADLHNQLSSTNTEIKNAERHLADLVSKVTAAVAAAKRQEEIETAQDFYRLNLPDIDIEEIQKLRQVTTLLRDSEPLNKVIWKVYYEKPYTDLIGRVVGTGVHTGIYKITNLENQKCYVGQAANIADRWKQHIKRGIGAEAPTRNKLYPTMLQHGVENFTFEIIEECPRDKLNEREDYWQNYFGAKEFGYSIK